MRIVLEALQDGVHKRVKKKQTDALSKMEEHAKNTQTRLNQLFKRQQQDMLVIFSAPSLQPYQKTEGNEFR